MRISTKVCHFIDMWPLAKGLARNVLASANRIYIVEGNEEGQLAMLLKMKAAEDGVAFHGPRVFSILRYDGRPIEPENIVERILNDVLPEENAVEEGNDG